MVESLVIVESPAKSKTLKKYLGRGFEVLASYGHVRDLVPKEGAVDTEHNFAMNYKTVDKNKKHVDAICKVLKGAKNLYLATDPDREGEAISYHLYELAKERGVLDGVNVYRIVFHEITKSAVQYAVQHPRELSNDLVNAQQTRRALDYLVGFNLSPLLWKKVRRGLSAGRVQSPALRLIVEREQEIEEFKPVEYWSVESDLEVSDKKFIGRLVEYDGEKLTQFSITNESFANEIEKNLIKAANGKLVVDKVKKSQRKRNPAAPFTTSTLQQEASRKLGFTAQKTMRVAQQLYEGIDTGKGLEGLITYMRTDSVNLANDALDELREFIGERYGKESLPSEPRLFKTKSKNAQEAHEAIRPTSVNLLPNEIKTHLSIDQFKLYNLIWKRAVACQMAVAIIDQVAVDLKCGDIGTFRANGSTIKEPGFMQVYLEGVDDSKVADSDENLLPEMNEGDKVNIININTNQHFTEPPPRFTEASLVKTLEEHGIGRPSTWASIISTLQQREYVINDKKRFVPTDVGKVVNKFLTSYFSKYVDYDFTANLEDSLDDVARGEKDWVNLLRDFWDPFISQVKEIEENVQRKDVTQEEIDEKCPKCEKPLSIRLGKSGRFIGCTGYPDCDYTRSTDVSRDESLKPNIVEDRKCPDCESDLIIKHGRFGKFIGCSNYPKCKFIESLEKPVDTEIECPKCKKGSLIKRKSRYGSYFYACSKYPACNYSVKNPPVSENCPTCDWPILTIKTTKKFGTQKVCPQQTCDYEVAFEELEQDKENG